MQLLVFAALSLSVAADSIVSTQILSETSVEASPAVVRPHITSTTPVQSLQAEAMQKLGITDVSEALKLMNGVSVKDYGGLGGMKCVSIRNLGATHTGVLYDGIPVSNAQAGQIDVARFGSQHLSEVRIGIGATQDVLTPAAVESYSGLLSLSSRNCNQAQVSYGSWNTLNVSSCYELTEGLSANANYRHTDGDYPFRIKNGDTWVKGNRNNDRVDDLNAELNYRSRYWQVKGAGYFNDRRLPGSIILYNYSSHEHMREANGLLQAQYLHPIGTHWKLVARAKYNHAMTHYNDGNQLENDVASAQHIYNYRQNEYYASGGGMGMFSTGPVRTRVSALYDVLHAALHSNLRTARSVQRTTHFGVLRADATYRKHTLQGALLYTLNREKDNKRQAWSPTLSANLQVWGNSRQSVHLRWMSRKAFRLPTFNEMYYYIYGSHNLKPEQAREHNLGITYGVWFEGVQLSVTADAYRYRVDDKLIAFPTAFAWKVGNLGKAESRGVELSMHVSVGSSCPIELSANYQWQDARNLDDPTNPNTYRKQLPYMPKQTANGAVTVHTRWADVGYTMQWMDERYSSTMNTFRYRLEPFCEHSLTLSRRWANFELQGTLQNLTDEQYAVIQYYPMPGRQYRITCKYFF
ncbi:MAG: TonB-dependent receptor plug domain-containing protein [Bacteroidales bacterium]|nr:TonB-dependent receptor plug domain-containing protein [Bacteroidales bacterium]